MFFVSINYIYQLKFLLQVSLERPDAPIVSKITYNSAELNWTHVKEMLPSDQRFKYTLQEISSNRKDWTNVYT